MFCYTLEHISEMCMLHIISIDKLIKQIGLKDNAKVVDLTGSKVVVESLTEAKIMCTAENKVRMKV